MPTRTPDRNPFDPRGTPTREQLLAYAEGRLSPAEQHAVERHMEHDPLLRDAMDGLREPGAVQAERAMQGLRPTAALHSNTTWWIMGGIVAVAVVIGVIALRDEASSMNDPTLVDAGHKAQPTETTTSSLPLESAEIASAEEQPANQRIGHERLALHHLATARRTMQRDPGITRVDPREPTIDGQSAPTSARPLGRSRTSRHLFFAHDLKLVHPSELYDRDPVMDLVEEHVAARFADASGRDSAHAQTITLAYTAFMDEALGRFVNNDHKGCLDDMRFLLDQYPDDVNALFYGGLCCYNLGMYDRARSFLYRAANHGVDIFDEEAAWYHALTLDRLNDPGARAAFARIAERDGFYSEIARARAAQ